MLRQRQTGSPFIQDKKEHEMKARSSAGKTGPVRSKAAWWCLALGLALAAGCGLIYGWLGSDEIPDDLIGYWVTDEPRYAEARMEITKETITFSKGLDYINMNEIDDVEVSDKKGKTLVKITYEDREGGEFTLSLYHYPGPRNGSIRFVNQMQMVWEKERETE